MSARLFRTDGEVVAMSAECSVLSAQFGLKPWERSFNGRHWYHMPGSDIYDQKVNFAMWRLGLAKYEELVLDETGVDGEPVMKLRNVQVVKFGAMGCGGGLNKSREERLVAYDAAARERAVHGPRKRKSRAKVVTPLTAAHVAEAARVRGIIQERQSVRGLLTRLAARVPMDANTLSRFLRGGTDLQPVRLARLASVLAEMPVEVPGLSLKDWIAKQAAAQCPPVKPHTYRMWMDRGRMARPVMVKMSERSFYVVEAEGEEGHRERLEHRRDAETLTTGGNEV